MVKWTLQCTIWYTCTHTHHFSEHLHLFLTESALILLSGCPGGELSIAAVPVMGETERMHGMWTVQYSAQQNRFLTLKVLNFWKFTSYCSLKPIWSGIGGSSAGSYRADPTSPNPSHCTSIVATSTVRVNGNCKGSRCVFVSASVEANKCPHASKSGHIIFADIPVILTLKVLVTTIDAQWEGMGDVGSARYELGILPPCLTIRVLSYSN